MNKKMKVFIEETGKWELVDAGAVFTEDESTKFTGDDIRSIRDNTKQALDDMKEALVAIPKTGSDLKVSNINNNTIDKELGDKLSKTTDIKIEKDRVYYATSSGQWVQIPDLSDIPEQQKIGTYFDNNVAEEIFHKDGYYFIVRGEVPNHQNLRGKHDVLLRTVVAREKITQYIYAQDFTGFRIFEAGQSSKFNLIQIKDIKELKESVGDIKLKLTNGGFNIMPLLKSSYNSKSGELFIESNNDALTFKTPSGHYKELMARDDMEKALKPYATTDETRTHSNKLVTGSSAVHGMKIQEGEFIPKLRCGEYDNTVSTEFERGYYYKINKMVYVEIHIKVARPGSGRGNAIITGLPFTNNTGEISFAPSVMEYIELSQDGKFVMPSCKLSKGSNTLEIMVQQNNGKRFPRVNTNFDEGSRIQVSGVYITDM